MNKISARRHRPKRLPDHGFPIHWHVRPQSGALGLCHSAPGTLSHAKSEIYIPLRWNTTSSFDTPAGMKVDATLHRLPDGVCSP